MHGCVYAPMYSPRRDDESQSPRSKLWRLCHRGSRHITESRLSVVMNGHAGMSVWLVARGKKVRYAERRDNMNIVIREIKSKDYKFVAIFWRDVIGALSVTDKMVTETCEKMKDDNRYETYVADVDGKIVGFVTTVETLAMDQANGYIKVNGLAVLPEFQHHGIGKMLMERVEKLAHERKISLIGLASGVQRRGAHEFYEHLGYQKLSFWFRKGIQ